MERAYLGKNEHVTMARLRDVGNDLAAALRTEQQEIQDAFQPKGSRITPEIVVADVKTDNTYLWLTLTDGRIIGSPLAWFLRLAHATPEERAIYTIRVAGVHGPTIDEDISARVLMGHPS